MIQGVHQITDQTMKTLLLSFLCCAIARPALAQAQDIGLTMDGGFLTVIYGQDCGPVGCTPFVAGPTSPGTIRTVTHYSAPQALYAVAIGLPGPCVTVPGFDNPLLLSNPIVIGWGLTSAPPFAGLPCQQGTVSEQINIPVGAPAGVVFRVQSFGQSLAGQFGFGPALESFTL